MYTYEKFSTQKKKIYSSLKVTTTEHKYNQNTLACCVCVKKIDLKKCGAARTKRVKLIKLPFEIFFFWVGGV